MKALFRVSRGLNSSVYLAGLPLPSIRWQSFKARPICKCLPMKEESPLEGLANSPIDEMAVMVAFVSRSF